MTIELVNAAISGNAFAMNDLIVAISKDCKAIISHYLGNKYDARVDADDVLQEVLTQVAQDIATCEFANFAAFKGWMFIVCRNNVYKQIEWIKTLSRDADRTCAMGEGFDVSGRSKTADQILEAREQYEMVMDLAKKLPAVEFEAIKALAAGNTPKEVAEGLGCDVSTVYYARRLLKDMVAGQAAAEAAAEAESEEVAEQANEPAIEEAVESGSVAVAVAVEVKTSTPKSTLRQWKKFYESVLVMEPVAREKALARFERTLSKLEPVMQSEMRAFIFG